MGRREGAASRVCPTSATIAEGCACRLTAASGPPLRPGRPRRRAGAARGLRDRPPSNTSVSGLHTCGLGHATPRPAAPAPSFDRDDDPEPSPDSIASCSRGDAAEPASRSHAAGARASRRRRTTTSRCRGMGARHVATASALLRRARRREAERERRRGRRRQPCAGATSIPPRAVAARRWRRALRCGGARGRGGGAAVVASAAVDVACGVGARGLRRGRKRAEAAVSSTTRPSASRCRRRASRRRAPAAAVEAWRGLGSRGSPPTSSSDLRRGRLPARAPRREPRREGRGGHRGQQDARAAAAR